MGPKKSIDYDLLFHKEEKRGREKRLKIFRGVEKKKYLHSSLFPIPGGKEGKLFTSAKLSRPS